MLITLTIACMLLIVYHHVGYPLLLKKLTQSDETKTKAKTKTRTTTTSVPLPLAGQTAAPDNDTKLATIALIIPAFNEQQFIADKIHNLAMLDYPNQLLKIIIACDGCTDNTAQIARETAEQLACNSLNIEIIEFKNNRGKVAIINKILPQITEQIIAMSDVSALISIDALTQANDAFGDQEVGLVTGHYLLATPGSKGEQRYWQYQSDVQQREAQLNSIIGAHGAFYLIRRELFLPLAPDTINDDFVIAMAVVEQGYRAIYVAAINAIELEQATQQMDLHRRRRIAAGNLQQLIRFRSLLLPRYKGVAFSFASGKALRVFMPVCLIQAWLGSILLTDSNLFFALAAALQSMIYGSVLMFRLLNPVNPNKIWQTIYYLVSGYSANLIGSIEYIYDDKCHQKLRMNHYE